MKRIWTLAVLMLCLCMTLCGCDLWMDGAYSSVKPHQAADSTQPQESQEVASYSELQAVLTELVADGSQSSVIYMTGYEQAQMKAYMNMAVRHVKQKDAIGAYAVDEITYEIGTNTGRTAIAVDITYNHGRSEILRIKQAENMEQAAQAITAALENCDAGVVVQVAEYEETDFTQLIQDHVDANPDMCMEMPQVAAAVYPETGAQRVVELTFTYQTSREALRVMQDYVGPVFRAAILNVSSEEEESVKFALMYTFLMERYDYQIETSITPAYSLLRHGVGDSKAFATVYAAMCRKTGLGCQVVSGTWSGEPRVWNIICEDGVYYHVDLLQSSREGRLYKLTAEEMQAYVWDYSAYPASGEIAQTAEAEAA